MEDRVPAYLLFTAYFVPVHRFLYSRDGLVDDGRGPHDLRNLSMDTAPFKKAEAAGWFEGSKAELLGGIVFKMTTKPPHLIAVHRLVDGLKRLAPEPAWVVTKEDNVKLGKWLPLPDARSFADHSKHTASGAGKGRHRTDSRGIRHDLRERPRSKIPSLRGIADSVLLDRRPQSTTGRGTLVSERPVLSDGRIL